MYAICSVEGCASVVRSKDMCDMHYQRMRKYGNPFTVIKALRTAPPEPIINGDGTAYIPLTKGKFALIDEADIPLVRAFYWFAGNNGYPGARISGMLWTMHRWLMKEELANNNVPQVDHINGNGFDCTRRNMRLSTQAINMQNTDRSKNRIGISFDSTHNRYKAYIDRPSRARINVGTFRTRIEAAAALATAKAKLEE